MSDPSFFLSQHKQYLLPLKKSGMTDILGIGRFVNG